MDFNLPSPIQKVELQVFLDAGLSVFIKRDDLIHPTISGNKWRKLKYNLEKLKSEKKEGIISFGGAYSNHLAAAAYACATENIPFVAIIRGMESLFDESNDSMNFLRQCGATLIPVTRKVYSEFTQMGLAHEIFNTYKNYLLVPEGGANLEGLKGCSEIIQEVNEEFDVVTVAVGTATTLSGMIVSGYQTKYIGFAALKGGDYLKADVNNFIETARKHEWVASTFLPPEWQLETSFHHGGFARTTPELIDFMNAFYAETGILLDPVYTAKMMFGLVQMAQKGTFAHGTRILAVHTGGLQGIKGMNQRLHKKKLQTIHEKVAVFPPTSSSI